MLRSKGAETDASRSGGLLPIVALLAAAAAIEYLLPGGRERSAGESWCQTLAVTLPS
jgi:hypothetical protein